MVPEISLTPQLENRFKEGLASRLMYGTQKLRQKNERKFGTNVLRVIDVLLSVHGLVFLPFKNLGLTVIDEEHDSSYKQRIIFATKQEIWRGKI